MGSLGEAKGRDMISSTPEPFVIELRRLENNIKDKERELKVAHCEIKALKVTESLKDKANLELSNEIRKLEAKLRNAEKQLEDKNLEIKKKTDEKKQALAAQFAAEATVRRVHASQRDEESVPVEAIKAQYESDVRMFKNQILTLKEDRKALERLLKSKEVALVESERNLNIAHEKALMVENLQNKNEEFKKQIEIFQEENRLLEKTNRQKVVEIEKLAQTIRELEESILAGGANANSIRDCHRQISELKENKRTLERELVRFKVASNRVATATANERKDESDRVMPVKQWLEERRILQGETQRLRDKLVVSERTIKAEAQLRDKLQLRLKTLEEGLKLAPILSNRKAEISEQIVNDKLLNNGPRKRSTFQPRASILPQTKSTSSVNSHGKNVRPNSKKTELVSDDPKSKFSIDIGKENNEARLGSNINLDVITPIRPAISEQVNDNENVDAMSQNSCSSEDGCEDLVSGFLYDKIQNELIFSRKLHEDKDGVVTAKDEEIKLLHRKVDALIKAVDVESKKMRRGVAVTENEKLHDSYDSKQRIGAQTSSKDL